MSGIAAWRSLLQLAIFMAIPSLLLVIRHTRTEETQGRRELLASSVLGRHAPLTAALIVVFGMNLLIAVGMSIGRHCQVIESTIKVAVLAPKRGCVSSRFDLLRLFLNWLLELGHHQNIKMVWKT